MSIREEYYISDFCEGCLLKKISDKFNKFVVEYCVLDDKGDCKVFFNTDDRFEYYEKKIFDSEYILLFINIYVHEKGFVHINLYFEAIIFEYPSSLKSRVGKIKKNLKDIFNYKMVKVGSY